MSVNEDLVLTILRKIQEDLAAVKTDVAGMKADMAVMKADIVETKDRLHTVEHRLDAVEYRLSNVEGLLVENVRETRAVMQIVKQHGHRLDTLEREPPH